MRIVRLASPRPHEDLQAYVPLSLAADRTLAAMYGRELHLYDLHALGRPPLRIPNIAAHALARDALVVSDVHGWLTRWECHDGRWEPATQLRAPAVPEARTQRPQRLLLSPSGGFLLLESGPIPTREGAGPVARAFLLDARSGEQLYTCALHKTWVRAAFGTLPAGDEVLWISAESPMSVQLIGCTQGRILHAYHARRSWDFCHTDYALSPDATRLFTFGGVWAAPYEVRVYDARPWTQAATARAGDAFPLPLVYRQEEVFHGDIVLPAYPHLAADGTFSCVALVTLPSLPLPGTADEGELLADLAAPDREIYDALQSLPRAGMAIVLRRVGAQTGHARGWSLAPIPATQEAHVHILPGHQVVLLNERVQRFDGLSGALHDKGALDVPAPFFVSRASSDGQTLALWWPEER